MTDIALKFDTALGGYDLALSSGSVGPDLATDDGMDTAIAISLFSDARARPDDRLPGSGSPGLDDPGAAGLARRGWWGDGLSDIDGDRTGSRLWLLGREKMTPELLNRIRDYTTEALDWLVADGVARTVAVAADWIDWTAGPGDRVMVGGRVVRAGLVGLSVTVTRPDGTGGPRHFDHVWRFLES